MCSSEAVLAPNLSMTSLGTLYLGELILGVGRGEGACTPKNFLKLTFEMTFPATDHGIIFKKLHFVRIFYTTVRKSTQNLKHVASI